MRPRSRLPARPGGARNDSLSSFPPFPPHLTKRATLRSNCPLPWTLKSSPLPTSIRATRRIPNSTRGEPRIGPLWDALRKKGRQVRVIGIAVENAILDRTDRVLETWAAADPGTSDEGLTPKQEINAIRAAMKRNDLITASVLRRVALFFQPLFLQIYLPVPRRGGRLVFAPWLS